MSKNDVFVIVIILALVGFSHYIGACETKRVYLPDGTMQICRVCKDVVICN